MNLTQLEMFNTIVTTSSITRAAREVYHAPSNPATHIHQLGAGLGIELFIRKNQCLRLSPAGHSFLRYSQQVLALVDEARAVVTDDEPQGPFSLGSLESTTAVWIPTTLARFGQRYPRIHLALSTSPSGTMIDDVLGGILSVAFVSSPLVHPGLEGLPAFSEEMIVVASYGHAPIDHASEVNRASVYALRANCPYHRHFESWFHADRATPDRIRKMGSYHGMLACVIAGAGLALIPYSMLESVLGYQQVSAWSLAEERHWLTAWLVWHRGAKTRQLGAFIAPLNRDRQTVISP